MLLQEFALLGGFSVLRLELFLLRGPAVKIVKMVMAMIFQCAPGAVMYGTAHSEEYY